MSDVSSVNTSAEVHVFKLFFFLSKV